MAASPQVISGRVQDNGGQAFQGARVYFSAGPEPLPEVAILTGQDGGFKLSAPIAGTYTIECSADGFQRASLTVDVANIPPEELKFILTPEK